MIKNASLLMLYILHISIMKISVIVLYYLLIFITKINHSRIVDKLLIVL